MCHVGELTAVEGDLLRVKSSRTLDGEHLDGVVGPCRQVDEVIGQTVALELF